MREVALIPVASRMMESTGAIGYKLSAAVADVIDNSIAANASVIKILTPDESSEFFSILDDGCGMTENELLNAMRYGSRSLDEIHNDKDLGRFGLGLKTASLSQCRCLTVLSKAKGRPIAGARWDLDYVRKSRNSWPLQVFDQDDIQRIIESITEKNNIGEPSELLSMDHGTIVIWSNLDMLRVGMKKTERGWNSIRKKIVTLSNDLSLTFHRFLETDDDHPPLTIMVNGFELSPRDPFLRGRSTTPYHPDPYTLDGERISVTPYILPHQNALSLAEKEELGNLYENQGFYIYRNRRLVIHGTWFGLRRRNNLSKLARVQVDIPASPKIDKLWSLDVKKSTAVVPDILKPELESTVEYLQGQSQNRFTRRGKSKIDKSGIWKRTVDADKKITYSLNLSNKIIEDVIKTNPRIKPILKLIAATLPMNQIFVDLSKEREIDTHTEEILMDEELKNKLAEAGIDETYILNL